MKRSRLVFLIGGLVVWLIIAGVIIWKVAGDKRRGEDTKRALMNATWVSTAGDPATLTFTQDKYILSYYGAVGRRPTKPVQYPYTVQGDIITLQGEKPIKLRIKLLTRDDLFLINEHGYQLHYENSDTKQREPVDR
jgi:hypothetical protein